MLRTVLLGLAGFGIAIVAASWLMPSPPADGIGAFGEDAFVAARISALESELAHERERRLVLERQLHALAQRVDLESAARAGGAAPVLRAAESQSDREMANDPPQRTAMQERLSERIMAVDGTSGPVGRRQIERLISGGFAPDRAEWIERRSEELRMEALNARYDAARDGRSFDPGNAANPERTLRAELGDQEYEQYLRALNRPTSVAVGRVLASSPAERAGLQPGDQIVSYGGERVFGMADLNDLTLQGAPGQTVIVDVLRDGQPIQLYMPRGPVGVVGGRRFVRR